MTVGSGIQPDLLTLPDQVRKALAGLEANLLTAGGDLHPALRTNAGKPASPSDTASMRIAQARRTSHDLHQRWRFETLRLNR
jgi:hypothetical protein